jgi:hypothetical protein
VMILLHVNLVAVVMAVRRRPMNTVNSDGRPYTVNSDGRPSFSARWTGWDRVCVRAYVRASLTNSIIFPAHVRPQTFAVLYRDRLASAEDIGYMNEVTSCTLQYFI